MPDAGARMAIKDRWPGTDWSAGAPGGGEL